MRFINTYNLKHKNTISNINKKPLHYGKALNNLLDTLLRDSYLRRNKLVM